MQKNTKQVNRFGPVELHQMRRLTVRAQKNQMIMRRLQDIPINYFQLQIIALLSLAICLIAVQIAMLVKQTPLSLVCAGFWIASILIICGILVYFLGEIQIVE